MNSHVEGYLSLNLLLQYISKHFCQNYPNNIIQLFKILHGNTFFVNALMTDSYQTVPIFLLDQLYQIREWY